MKILYVIFIVVTVLAANTGHATGNKLSAKELCADDFWKWCSANEAPFDCFKRRGFFKKDSVLSMDCRRAWVKPKQESDQTAQTNPPKQQELRAQERQPSQQNIEEPKETVAPRKPSSEPAKTPVPQPEIIDDFSELSFD